MPSPHPVLQALMSSPHETNVKAGLDVLEFMYPGLGPLHARTPGSSTALGASTQQTSDIMQSWWPRSAAASHEDDDGWGSLMAAVVQLSMSSSMLGE